MSGVESAVLTSLDERRQVALAEREYRSGRSLESRTATRESAPATSTQLRAVVAGAASLKERLDKALDQTEFDTDKLSLDERTPYDVFMACGTGPDGGYSCKTSPATSSLPTSVPKQSTNASAATPAQLAYQPWPPQPCVSGSSGRPTALPVASGTMRPSRPPEPATGALRAATSSITLPNVRVRCRRAQRHTTSSRTSFEVSSRGEGLTSTAGSTGPGGRGRRKEVRPTGTIGNGRPHPQRHPLRRQRRRRR